MGVENKYKKIKSLNKDEHIVVWEAAFGEVPVGSVVHHINGIKGDNRIENLAVMTRGEHARFHLAGVPLKERASESQIAGCIAILYAHSQEIKKRFSDGNGYCRSCKQYLPAENFNKNKSRCDGLSNICKPCLKEERAKAG